MRGQARDRESTNTRDITSKQQEPPEAPRGNKKQQQQYQRQPLERTQNKKLDKSRKQRRSAFCALR
eukprot:9501886-Alexandrium_andersonii.AAC.1